MPLLRFVCFSLGGALLWSATFLALGGLFHAEVQRLVALLAEHGGWIVGVGTAGVGLFVALRRAPRWRWGAAPCGS
jgi:membrane protein DedA with SNARE-associated domain